MDLLAQYDSGSEDEAPSQEDGHNDDIVAASSPPKPFLSNLRVVSAAPAESTYTAAPVAQPSSSTYTALGGPPIDSFAGLPKYSSGGLPTHFLGLSSSKSSVPADLPQEVFSSGHGKSSVSAGLPKDFFGAGSHQQPGSNASPLTDLPKNFFSIGLQPAVNPTPGSPISGEISDEAAQGREAAVGPVKPPEFDRSNIDPDEIPSASTGPGMFSQLPAPKTATKKVIKLKLPIQKQLLKKIEEDKTAFAADDARPAKKPKTSSSSSLVDFLPAPTNASAKNTSSLADLFSRKTPASASEKLIRAEDLDVGPSRMPADFQHDAFSNEMYRVADEAGSSGQGVLGPEQGPAAAYADGTYWPAGEDYGAASAGASEQWQASHEVAGYYVEGGTWNGAGTVGEDDLQQALEAEKERALRKGDSLKIDEIQFKEINQAQLKHVDPACKESHDALRNALGSEYALKLRAKAAAFTGNKLARRKHQIGTLFHNAKMRELELMETRAQAMKNKAETQGKYGW